jgi:hypothetical protein
MHPSMTPGAKRSLPQIDSCLRSLHLFDLNTTMSSAGAVGPVHHLHQMFAPLLIRSTAVASRDGRRAMRQRQHRQTHAAWPTYRIDMHLTAPATTRTIRCQHTHQAHITTLDKLHKICSTHRATLCTPTPRRSSHLRTNNTTWRYRARCLHKVSFVCCKAILIATEAAHRTLQTFRIRQTCTLRCMKNL